MQVLALVGSLAVQVVVLGGVWAALAGSDFLFWSFDETNIGAAALILFVVDPIAMGVGGMVLAAVAAVFSLGRSDS